MKLCAVGMRNAILGNDLKQLKFDRLSNPKGMIGHFDKSSACFHGIEDAAGHIIILRELVAWSLIFQT